MLIEPMTVAAFVVVAAVIAALARREQNLRRRVDRLETFDGKPKS